MITIVTNTRYFKKESEKKKNSRTEREIKKKSSRENRPAVRQTGRTDRVYSSREREREREKLWGQLSPGDNSYCRNKAVVSVPSRDANCSLQAVLVTYPSPRLYAIPSHVSNAPDGLYTRDSVCLSISVCVCICAGDRDDDYRATIMYTRARTSNCLHGTSVPDAEIIISEEIEILQLYNFG